MNRADRVSEAQLEYLIEDLEVGLLDIPELEAVGSHVSVLEPKSTQALSLEMFGDGCSVEVLDREGGIAESNGLFMTGDKAYRDWSSVEVHRLVVKLAPWVVVRWAADRTAAGTDRASIERPPEPDWDAQLALAERVDATSQERRGEREGRDDTGGSFAAALRARIEERRSTWPGEPADGRHRSTAEAKRWGPVALRRALEAAADAGFDRGETPFAPGIRLVTHVGAGYRGVPLGASHLHGFAHLPADFDWPEWDCPGYDGPPEASGFRWRTMAPSGSGPLTFLAQIDLAEVPFDDWWPGPRDGHLLVFVDMDRLIETRSPAEQYGPGGHRVFHVPSGTPLQVVVPPWRHANYGKWGWTEPDHQRGVRHIGYGKTALVTFEPIDTVRYDALEEAYAYDTEIPEALRDDIRDGLYHSMRDWHWLGGAPNPAQDQPLATAVRGGLGLTTGIREECDRWVQLLQLASDVDTDTMWGDMGLLHVFIRRDDLAAGRFDRTLMDFQCS